MRQEETPQVPLIVVRIQAPTRDLDQFVSQYCRYFGVDVVFLPTEGLQPPGRQVRFTFVLADEREVIVGEGIVLRMRRDTGNPLRPPGMELRYQLLDEDSQQIVERMLEERTSVGVTRKPDPPPYVSMWFEQEITRNGAQPQSAPEPPAPERPAWAVVAERSVLATRRDETVQGHTKPPPARLPPGTLPANPFADVPAAAIGYFVDWAIERATDRGARWTAGAYGGIPLGAPGRRRRTGMMAAFSAGLVTGGAVFMLGGAIALELAQSRVAVSVVAPAARSSAFGLESGAQAAAPSLGVGGAIPPAHATPPPIAPAVPIAAPAPREIGARADSSLQVVSHPPGAWVRVDGRLRGRTPLTVAVEPGAHEVAIDHARYAAWHVEARAPGLIHAELERPAATLQIDSQPPGARVIVDGHSLGATPLAFTTTGYERHRVQLELDGQSARRRLYLKPPGDTIAVELNAQSMSPAR